jgi:hypothetical protein
MLFGTSNDLHIQNLGEQNGTCWLIWHKAFALEIELSSMEVPNEKIRQEWKRRTSGS